MISSKIESFVTTNPDWQHIDNSLYAEWEFASFTAIERIVPRLLQIATEMDHHPVVSFGYNWVSVTTTTHDVGKTVSELDIALARRVSKLVVG